MIEITNFKANYGDTFLIAFHRAESESLYFLIDCGFGFNSGALPVLEKLGEDGKCLERLIITHFDADHIAGAYSFLEKNGKKNEPQIIPIKEIWLNTFRHLQFEKRAKPDQVKNDPALLNAAMSEFKPATPTEEGEIGAKQALLLGRLILGLGYDWNSDFKGEAAMAGNTITIDEKITIVLLSPNIQKLKALEDEFIDKLAEFDLVVTPEQYFDDAFELYALQQSSKTEIKEGPISGGSDTITIENILSVAEDYEYDADDAPGNGSSISLLIEADNKKMLFLADAHAEDIIQSLSEKYLAVKERPLFFDVIKVAHHGSFRNNAPALFDLIDSDKWIISTNGKHPKHQHPDFATLAYIVKRDLPPGVKKRILYFNYEPKHLMALDDQELKNRFNYEIKVQPDISL
jgi:hypothetical protein